MFVNNIRKVISGIIISYIIFFPFVPLKSEINRYTMIKNIKLGPYLKNSSYAILKHSSYAYGVLLVSAVAHEFGHWIVGKKIHKCNGFFYVTPKVNGVTYHYYNPTSEAIRAVWNGDTSSLEIPDSPPLVYTAGPLFGIGFSLLVPFLHTFYHECKQNQILNALKKTALQPSLKNQPRGIKIGVCLSIMQDLHALLSDIPGSDGFMARRPSVRDRVWDSFLMTLKK